MSKVLIIADGKHGHSFISKILEDEVSQNHYHILTHDTNIKATCKKVNNSSQIILFSLHINTNSLTQIIKKHNYQHIAICLKTKVDTREALDIVSKIDTTNKISFLNHWKDFKCEDESVLNINSYDILSNRLLNTLPNIPVSAENIGLAKSELIEVSVPRESDYIYKRISSISQRNFSIAAIYRKGEVVLPTAFSMIQAGDKLLAVGKPPTLQTFYKSVNKIGYSLDNLSGLYLLIDMLEINSRDIFILIKKTIRFYKKLKLKSILIKVVNPTHIDLLEKIKNLYTRYIVVEIDFNTKDSLLANIKKLNPAFIITNTKVFQKNKKIFYRARIPILTTSNGTLAQESFIIPSIENYLFYESIASLVFDFSKKMDLDITLFNMNDKKKDALLEHYQALSGILKKKIKITKQELNPIIDMKAKKNTTSKMQILPLSENILYINKITAPFSKNNDLLHYKLSHYDQLFLPI